MGVDHNCPQIHKGWVAYGGWMPTPGNTQLAPRRRERLSKPTADMVQRAKLQGMLARHFFLSFFFFFFFFFPYAPPPQYLEIDRDSAPPCPHPYFDFFLFSLWPGDDNLVPICERRHSARFSTPRLHQRVVQWHRGIKVRPRYKVRWPKAMWLETLLVNRLQLSFYFVVYFSVAFSSAREVNEYVVIFVCTFNAVAFYHPEAQMISSTQSTNLGDFDSDQRPKSLLARHVTAQMISEYLCPERCCASYLTHQLARFVQEGTPFEQDSPGCIS
jgi:hypothetical protein